MNAVSKYLRQLFAIQGQLVELLHEAENEKGIKPEAQLALVWTIRKLKSVFNDYFITLIVLENEVHDDNRLD